MGNKKRGTFSQIKRRAITGGALYPMLVRFSTLEAQPLLQEIKNKQQGDILRKALVNYLIIRSVTIFEIFLINEAYRLAKHHRRKTKELFTDVKTNVPLADQLISTYSFTKLEDIDFVFSTLISKNYLSAIKADSVEYEPDYYLESAHIKRTKPLHKNWDNVCKIFELRHDIVHHNKLIDLKYSQLRNLLGGIIQFLMSSIIVTNED